jgi:hypothetical protein
MACCCLIAAVQGHLEGLLPHALAFDGHGLHFVHGRLQLLAACSNAGDGVPEGRERSEAYSRCVGTGQQLPSTVWQHTHTHTFRLNQGRTHPGHAKAWPLNTGR